LKDSGYHTEDVRQGAAAALGQLQKGTPEVIRALILALKDSSSSVRQGVAAALGQRNTFTPEVAVALCHTLNDSNWDVRQAVTTALANLGHSDEIVAVLCRLFEVKSARQTYTKEQKRGIAHSLGEGHLALTNALAIEALVCSLDDPVLEVQCASAFALSNYIGQGLLLAKLKELKGLYFLGQNGGATPETNDGNGKGELLKNDRDITLQKSSVPRVSKNSLTALSVSDEKISKYRNNNPNQGYIRHRVIGDGDCGYTAFGITRQKAFAILTDAKNLLSIRDLLKQAIQAALLTEKFYTYLINNKVLDKTTKPHSVIIDNLSKFATDLNVVRAYINYDVRDKCIDSGWAHPCILQALACLRSLTIRMWTLGDHGKLLPHRGKGYDYSIFVPHGCCYHIMYSRPNIMYLDDITMGKRVVFVSVKGKWTLYARRITIRHPASEIKDNIHINLLNSIAKKHEFKRFEIKDNEDKNKLEGIATWYGSSTLQHKPQDTVDLLFLNGNHFDRVELLGYQNSILKKPIYPFNSLFQDKRRAGSKEDKTFLDSYLAAQNELKVVPYPRVDSPLHRLSGVPLEALQTRKAETTMTTGL